MAWGEEVMGEVVLAIFAVDINASNVDGKTMTQDCYEFIAIRYTDMWEWYHSSTDVAPDSYNTLR